MPTIQAIGDTMREYRKREGLTQGQLGELLGAKQTDISRIENGRIRATPELEEAFWNLWKAPREPEPAPLPEPPASGSGEAEGVLLELMTAARSELGHPMSPEEAEKLSRAGPEELLTQSVLLREALEVQASRELLAGAKAFRRRRESARSGGGQKC